MGLNGFPACILRAEFKRNLFDILIRFILYGAIDDIRCLVNGSFPSPVDNTALFFKNIVLPPNFWETFWLGLASSFKKISQSCQYFQWFNCFLRRRGLTS
jgi:hypothetical protein